MRSFNLEQWDIENIYTSAPELQRFMPFNERAIEALSSPYLWFSRIEEFNDPFEAQSQYIFKREPASIINSTTYSAASGWPFDEAETKLWAEYEADPEQFFHKWRLHFIDTYEQAASHAKYAYCCFFSEKDSQRPTNQEVALMWSHYGNGLRGMRVTFDTKTLITSMENEVRANFISYSSTPQEIDLLYHYDYITGPKGPRYSEDLFLENPSTKSDIWEYESELRIASQEPGANRFDPAAIKRVDLGDKMPESQKRVISMLIQQLNPMVRMYIAKVIPGSFDICYKPYHPI